MRTRANAPRIELASPERYFRHIEEGFGDDPVYRAEWGGHWDAQHWAQRPITYWRLRQAARTLTPDAPQESKAALATALDHSLGGSACSIWGFSDSQVRESGSEFNEWLSRAVRLTLGAEGLEMLPPAFSRPASGQLSEPWRSILADDTLPVRFRAGPNWIGPFHGEAGDEWEIPLELGADDDRIVIQARIDRTDVPGSRERLTYVVVEIPLRANVDAVRLSPEGVPNALMNRWLLDEPPNGIVTADGVRVIGLERELTVTSPLIVSWTLLPDRSVAERSWLQGLVIAQSELCELSDGTDRVYSYSLLYEGEPAIVDVGLELRLR